MFGGISKIRDYTDHVAFIDTLEQMGLPFSHNHQLAKDKWQELVDRMECNISSLGCFGIVVGDTTFVFSTGQPDWNGGEENPKGRSGSFMFSYNEKTEEYIKRSEPFAPGE